MPALRTWILRIINAVTVAGFSIDDQIGDKCTTSLNCTDIVLTNVYTRLIYPFDLWQRIAIYMSRNTSIWTIVFHLLVSSLFLLSSLLKVMNKWHTWQKVCLYFIGLKPCSKTYVGLSISILKGSLLCIWREICIGKAAGNCVGTCHWRRVSL